jgi:hypothetical protein
VSEQKAQTSVRTDRILESAASVDSILTDLTTALRSAVAAGVLEFREGVVIHDEMTAVANQSAVAFARLMTFVQRLERDGILVRIDRT